MRCLHVLFIIKKVYGNSCRRSIKCFEFLHSFFLFSFFLDVEGGVSLPKEQTNNQWFRDGNDLIRTNLKVKENRATSKNVIMFLGDGMGISTVTAARILEGQLRGKTGEENFLSFEKWPWSAMSKTYNTDQQTADSAGTAVAYLSGVKTRAGENVNKQTEKQTDK